MPKLIFLDGDGDNADIISSKDRPVEERIVFEMLDQRGYRVIEETEDYLFAKRSFFEKILIFFEKDTGLDTKNLKKIISQAMEKGVKHMIIVYSGKITPAVSAILEKESFEKFDKKDEFDFTNIDIEIFERSELQFNITKHILQPTIIEKLNHVDREKLKSVTGLKIPYMLKKDPIARFFHFKRGDVIKMVRRDDTIVYRIVK